MIGQTHFSLPHRQKARWWRDGRGVRSGGHHAGAQRGLKFLPPELARDSQALACCQAWDVGAAVPHRAQEEGESR